MGALVTHLPFWASLLFVLNASAEGSHLNGAAEGPVLQGPSVYRGQAPDEIGHDSATTSREDVLVPLRATKEHRWCNALDLRSTYGACSSNRSAGQPSVLPETLDNGCFGVVLLLLLLAAADQSERLLRRVWGPLRSLANLVQRSRTRYNSSNNRFAAAAETEEGKKLLDELASLQKQLVQEQMQQQQLSATAEFAAYARKQRKIDQLVSSRDTCIQHLQQLQQQQQPHQQQSKSSMPVLLRAVYQLLLKPIAKRHGYSLVKPLVCWAVFVSMGARIILPTAQLTPLNLLGPRCHVVFPFAFVICRIFLNEVYILLAVPNAQSAASSTAKARAIVGFTRVKILELRAAKNQLVAPPAYMSPGSSDTKVGGCSGEEQSCQAFTALLAA
ncbi:hypothetical protein, conserved [Eimeria maxima]|uniref:Uncharacterized protein n=1 Tax=Eimeria maxima TaxID=5804 RepID=U6M9E5_EIMMA|nr:hypothetical protein, conserved [Eimeria maxima]CDJ59089.1 hypothetical protein, conserved [Eimeria maxima]